MGGVVHTVMAPIEWAKLLRQTQESNAALPGHPRRQRFQGMVDCVSRTVREEGFLSLWRGNGTSVLRYYPSVALNFSLMDLYRKMLKGGEASVDGRWTSVAGAKFMAGAAAGCTTSAIIYIAHTLRCPPMQGHLPLPPQRKTASAASTRAYLPCSYFGGLLFRWVRTQAVTTMLGRAGVLISTRYRTEQNDGATDVLWIVGGTFIGRRA